MPQAVGRAARGRRVGFFGGAFDPPHRAHAALVRVALEHLRLDELRIVPTGQAWHKARALSPAAQRLAMAQLAFGDLPGVVLDRSEIDRDGPSYTIDTLAQWRQRHPHDELFLLIGEDQARSLPQWHRWQDILSLATICVAARPDSTGPAGRFDAHARTVQPAPLQEPAGAAGHWLSLPLPATALSATEIRARVAAGQDIGDRVTGPVARYIAQHHLYQRP